jgi:hypothetical protein
VAASGAAATSDGGAGGFAAAVCSGLPGSPGSTPLLLRFECLHCVPHSCCGRGAGRGEGGSGSFDLVADDLSTGCVCLRQPPAPRA